MEVAMLRSIMRALMGLLFVGHGLQKLTGSFGGHGPEGTGQFFETLGLRPGKRHAIAAGAAETGGGALLALGLLTPVAAAALIGTMVTAVRTVHIDKGPWAADGGWEYNAILIAGAATLAEVGPGPLSLDHALGTERTGPLWGLFALAAGVGGSFAVMAAAEAAPDEASSGQATAAAPDTPGAPAPPSA
jgi:putative oxidoreductase